MTEYSLVSKKATNYDTGTVEIPDDAIEVNVEYGWDTTGLGRKFRCARVDYLRPVDDGGT